ncbi:MAG: type I secretion system permease/ATPase [Onishia taeanensis]|uniref:type I secretion system permease/ATPase n=1 Tax=Onishia taeanensis TaxID=284577 RepID=UPI003C7D1468
MAVESRTVFGDALESCRHSLRWVCLFSLFINLLMLTPALYMLQVYDRVVTTGSEATLLLMTLLVIFFFCIMGGLEWVRSRVLVRLGNRFDMQLHDRLHGDMFWRDFNLPGRHGAWPLDDLATLRQALAGGGLLIFFDAVWVPIYLIVLTLFHPWFGSFAAIAGALLLALAVINEKVTRQLLDDASRDQAESRELAASNLRNAEVLHAMGMLGGIRRRWARQHRRYLAKQSMASDRAGLLFSLTRTLRLAAQSLILGLGALLVLNEQITPGMMIAGSLLMGRALAPVDQAIGGWKSVVAARAAYRRLEALFREVPSHEERMALPPPRGELTVKSMAAGSPGEEWPIIRGVNLAIAAGEHVGIIGASAAGKSTLARVLLGIWPARQGSVRLDGAEITQWQRESLGPYLGYLPQDIELFEGSVGENIARFDELNADKVVAAASRAGVHEMILHLPEGYDTHLTPKGGVLSAGQRQRIGLARALYDDPALVVLDEPNSNLDHQGEKALTTAMQELKREGVTLLVISHRTGVLKEVDSLLLMEQGQVRLFGPRERVLASMAGEAQA